MKKQLGFPRWLLVPLVLLAVNGLLVLGIYLGGFYGRNSIPLDECVAPTCAEIKDDLDPVTYGLFCPEER